VLIVWVDGNNVDVLGGIRVVERFHALVNQPDKRGDQQTRDSSDGVTMHLDRAQ
jgi:hypothetical protein